MVYIIAAVVLIYNLLTGGVGAMGKALKQMAIGFVVVILLKTILTAFK